MKSHEQYLWNPSMKDKNVLYVWLPIAAPYFIFFFPCPYSCNGSFSPCKTESRYLGNILHLTVLSESFNASWFTFMVLFLYVKPQELESENSEHSALLSNCHCQTVCFIWFVMEVFVLFIWFCIIWTFSFYMNIMYYLRK